MRRALAFAAIFFWSALAAAQSVYFGTLHSHTSYSDGLGTPEQAYNMARAAGLDFFSLTEHNHDQAQGSDRRGIATVPQLYAGPATSLIATADRLNAPGSFVTIYGQEISTISAGNHINIFGVSRVVSEATVPNGNVPALLSWAQANRDAAGAVPLLQFNHPRNPERELHDYGRDDFAPSEWVSSLDPYVEMIEVLNAPALKSGRNHRAHAKEGYYLAYLNLGFHVGPSVGHDNHHENWGVSTDARIGVVASALTRPAIMSALRSRRTFATEDKNLEVIFRSGNSLGGDIVLAPAHGSELPLSVEIRDGDEAEANARYEVDVLADTPGGDRAKRVETFIINGNTPGPKRLEGVRFQRPGQYVLLRITQMSAQEASSEHQEQEDRVWTAPIWYEANAEALLPAAATLQITHLLPNPVGNEFRNESVTLRNSGRTAQSLIGWQVRDASGNVWSLVDSIPPGQTLTILRAGRMMSLNNDGDFVELVNPSGVVVDAGRYERAAEGQTVVLERP